LGHGLGRFSRAGVVGESPDYRLEIVIRSRRR